MTGPRAAVIGVGNEFRGDDGIGPAVAGEVGRRNLPGVRVEVCDGEPAGLLQAWEGVELAIVVDALLCDPAAPGRVWRSIVDQMPGTAGVASSHAMGIPEALLLGQALGLVPDTLVVFAVEAASLELGTGLSPQVTAAMPEVVEAVLAELNRVGGGSPPG